MEESNKNTVFYTSLSSGILMYILDHGDPVTLRFSSMLKVEVILDGIESSDCEVDNLTNEETCLPTPSDTFSVEISKNENLFEEDTEHMNNRDAKPDVKEIDWLTSSHPDKENERSLSKKDDTSSLPASPASRCDVVVVPGEAPSIYSTSGIYQENIVLKTKKRPYNTRKKGKDESEFVGTKEPSENSQKCKSLKSTKGRRPKRQTVGNSILQEHESFEKEETSDHNLTTHEDSCDNDTISDQSFLRFKEYKSKHQTKGLGKNVVHCEYCKEQFANKKNFFDHRKAKESQHTCDCCGKVEPFEAYLIVHMQKHELLKCDSRSDSQTEDNKSNEIKVKSECSSSEEKRIDDLSKKTWHTQGKEKSEKKKGKEKMKCSICGLVVSSKDSLKIHTMQHTNEMAYRCCVCGETFSCLSSRQHHMASHISEHKFKCIPCNQGFESRAELAKHQQTHELSCSICGEIFPNRTSRNSHYRVAHPKEILKCTLCTRMFASEVELTRHMVYHRKENRKQCPECGIVVSKLKDHMLVHRKDDKDKVFACDQCPERFLRRTNLERHMLIHSGEKPYACNQCTKRFRSNGMLRKHLLTHTREKPHQCDICGKSFSLRSNLSVHIFGHSTKKKYNCDKCEQTFSNKSSLLAHVKSNHPRRPVNPNKQTSVAHSLRSNSLIQNAKEDRTVKCEPMQIYPISVSYPSSAPFYSSLDNNHIVPHHHAFDPETRELLDPLSITSYGHDLTAGTSQQHHSVFTSDHGLQVSYSSLPLNSSSRPDTTGLSYNFMVKHDVDVMDTGHDLRDIPIVQLNLPTNIPPGLIFDSMPQLQHLSSQEDETQIE